MYYNGLYHKAPKEYRFISLSHKGVHPNSLDSFYEENFKNDYTMYFKTNQNEGKSLQDKVMDILVGKLKDYKRPEQRQHI